MKKMILNNMVIDFKRGRIRIPKAALRMIDSPGYIRLFINTEEKYIAVSAGETADSMSYRVPDHVYTTRASFTLHSLPLIRQIKLYGNFDDRVESCPLRARACLDDQFIVFSFPEETQTGKVQEYHGSETCD